MKLPQDKITVLPLTLQQLSWMIEDMPALEADLGLAYRGEWIDNEFRDILIFQKQHIEQEPAHLLFYTLWLFVLNGQFIIGSACFKGPPNTQGEIEIGYGIAPIFQNLGYTTNAIAQVCTQAFTMPGINAIVAETDIGNIASHRVLQKCRFTRYKQVEQFYWWRLPANA